MTLSATLKLLGSKAEFPPAGSPQRRWGQILRENPAVRGEFEMMASAELLVPLVDVADVAGGVVTRANAYFVVREVPFEEIPPRFKLTRRDVKRIAVVEDGLKTLHRIERDYLRPIVKGPDSLLGPRELADSDLRLFDCGDLSKTKLRGLYANGALAYLSRGEKVSYKVSADTLKGGIPAQRSNIRDRKPYWYSLHAPSPKAARIIVPEHFDERFVATLLDAGSEDVVLDKLFIATPRKKEDAHLLLASLCSLPTWYQVEVRGRTQLGEGVLEMKRADWDGVLVLNPSRVDAARRKKIMEGFAALEKRGTDAASTELADPARQLFDLAILEALEVAEPEPFRIELERELRAGIAERKERPASVADAKATRSAVKRVATNVDAYSARIAASLEPFPDPRNFVPASGTEDLVLISGAVEATLTIGEDLLTLGDVFSGDSRIAATGDIQAAQFVRSVLIHDPELTVIGVPNGDALRDTMLAWQEAVSQWRGEFERVHTRVAGAIPEERTRTEVRDRALTLLHAA